jgi:hypothetical protein
MAGFDWNTFYSLFKSKMSAYCTVGRYTIPKSPAYPYLDIALSDNSGGAYNLRGGEGCQNPMLTIEVYCNNYDDSTCYDVSMKAKELMLSYGFQCKTGPVKVTNSDPAVARWIARYKRPFGAGEKLRKVN